MREILFRGFHEDKNGTEIICINGNIFKGNWVYGVPVEIEEFVEIYVFDMEEFEVKYYLVIPETVGQYTGLTDKNGKKIFEGDILNMHGGCEQMDISEYDVKCRVVYSRKNYGAEIGYTGMRLDCGITMPLMCEGALTVIGNIHDNPELLEVE